MISTNRQQAMAGAMVTILLGASSTAYAQPAAADTPWSVEVGIGWDNGITGNINSSGIGQINNQVVVITKNSYNDVYGAGLHLRFGGGYMINEATEARVTFTFQSLDADFMVPMGDIGVSNLYGQYTDYQTFGLDVGLRRYGDPVAEVTRLRRGHDRHRVRRQDGRDARRARGQSRGRRQRLLRPDGRVHARASTSGLRLSDRASRSTSSGNWVFAG